MLRKADTTRAGFSLIELLVVVSIIAIVLALSFPMIGAMQRDTGTSSAVNTVGIAISAARRYATDPKNTFARTDIDSSNTESSEPGLYSGVAAIFTPAGEIRLAKNYESARFDLPGSPPWYLERHGPQLLPTNNLDALHKQPPGLPQRELNGFQDLGIDYILLGSDVGVVGITRNQIVNANDPPLLLTPPFAIWFDQNGYMVVTGQDSTRPGPPDNDYQFVYYDGDYDGSYECTLRRPGNLNYDPDEYNPNSGRYNRNLAWGTGADKYKLPFERLEAVIGVIVYSHDAFNNAVEDGLLPSWVDADWQDNLKIWRWMKANGQVLMFSRQTGMMMRNRDE